jgi:hypothetical protein
LAKVISGVGPMQAFVQPYTTGSSTFLPLLDIGEIDFGIIHAVDMGMAYHPAAVQFYKERKVRPAKMDELQKKMLAMNP